LLWPLWERVRILKKKGGSLNCIQSQPQSAVGVGNILGGRLIISRGLGYLVDILEAHR
jgi:hypothetical protein